MSNSAPAASKPKVSIVIPCYNGSGYLEECLRSVVQTVDPSDEILVVDDGSTEDIRGVTERYAPVVRYLRQSNQGTAAARNTGIRASRGEYIRCLDSDDCLLSAEAQLQQIALLDEHPEVGMVYGMALLIDSNGRQLGWRKPPFARTSYVRSGVAELADLLFQNYITLSTTLVRRSALDQAGLFRIELFGPEDWDRWLDIARMFSIGYVAAPIAAYRLHGTSVTSRYRIHSWLRMHTEILDRVFSDPEVAKCHAALRPAVTARLHLRAVRLAERTGETHLAWQHAGHALAYTLPHRQWRDTAWCLWLLAKGYMPAFMRTGMRQAKRRIQIATMTTESPRLQVMR